MKWVTIRSSTHFLNINAVFAINERFRAEVKRRIDHNNKLVWANRSKVEAGNLAKAYRAYIKVLERDREKLYAENKTLKKDLVTLERPRPKTHQRTMFPTLKDTQTHWKREFGLVPVAGVDDGCYGACLSMNMTLQDKDSLEVEYVVPSYMRSTRSSRAKETSAPPQRHFRKGHGISSWTGRASLTATAERLTRADLETRRGAMRRGRSSSMTLRSCGISATTSTGAATPGPRTSSRQSTQWHNLQ